LAVYAGGSGTPLVVVGGALSDHRAVTPLRPLLEPHFTVYAYDRRGRGGSGDAASYAVQSEIEDRAAIVDLAGPGAVVYGHSSGAILAMEAAAQGLRAGRLAVYEPPYHVDSKAIEDLPERLAALVRAGDGARAVRTFLQDGPGISEAALDKMSAAPFWPAMVAIAPTVVYDATIALVGQVSKERFARLPMPVTVMYGDSSPNQMHAAAAALAEAVPAGTLVGLSGQDHNPDPTVRLST
jgi:pimeloyl-ACP methyl ester carboxylesterase